MPCEHYKDALIEVAASGGAPQGAWRAHLDECASCRAALDEELSLFGAIDSGLHATANGEVPPSLLPRVRARLDGVTPPHLGWSLSWFALAGAVATAAALFLVMPTRQNNPRPAPTSLTANRTPAPLILPSAEGTSPSALPKKGSLVPLPPASSARNSGQSKELVSRKPMPELLVPRDQEILLANYAREWDSRKHAPLVAVQAEQKAVDRLEFSPIQIGWLDVKPLAEGDSQ